MTLEQRVALLEETFRTIERDRMSGVPILHPELRVEAVGFRNWNSYGLGILITPWFMNLILLPVQPDEWRGLSQGSAQRFIFPAGSYDFLLAEEEGIGQFRTCSLFSPMSAFADQAGAVATAAAAMSELFRDTARAPQALPPRDPGRGYVESVKKKIERPMSRRDLLRGAFLRGGDGK